MDYFNRMLRRLEDAMVCLDVFRALAVERKLADWMAGIVSGLDEAQIQRMLIAEHGGMNEVLADLAVGLSGTNSHPLHLQGSDALLGKPVDDATLAALGKLVQKQVSPMRTTVTQSNYRRLVAAVLAQRLVSELAGAA